MQGMFTRYEARIYGPDHDTFLFLADHGTRDDIPILLYGLREYEENNGQRGGCPYAHCITAIMKITGVRTNYSFPEWSNWWSRTREEPLDWHPFYIRDTKIGGLVPWKEKTQAAGDYRLEDKGSQKSGKKDPAK